MSAGVRTGSCAFLTLQIETDSPTLSRPSDTMKSLQSGGNNGLGGFSGVVPMPVKFTLTYEERSRSQINGTDRLTDAIAVCRRVLALVFPVVRSALNL
jgi:hypothetical protein